MPVQRPADWFERAPHGITYFCNDESEPWWEDGELEELQEKSNTGPEKCVPVHDGTVSSCWLFGEEWVWECPKCQERLLQYQNFIWNNRRAISEFLNKTLKAEAERTRKELESQTISFAAVGGEWVEPK